MTLGEKQELFSVNLSELLWWCEQHDIKVRIGEVHRPPETAAAYAASGRGIKNSLHVKKLAADLFLRKKGTSDIWNDAVYALAGEYWKSLHSLNRWGGDFTSRDSVHFSIEHGGVK